jgi:putative endonuclease
MSAKRRKPHKKQAAAWREKFLAWWSRFLHEYPRHRLGRKGERAAARFLRQRGYTILRRNVRYRYGELDLIALRDDVVAFVEVRTRRQGTHADLFRSIDRAKQHRLYRAACAVIKRYHLSNRHLRFDIITILWPEGKRPDIQHHPKAFIPG